MPIQNNVILYESFSGEGIIDNPRGLFIEFTKRIDFYNYIHVWVIKESYNYSFDFIQLAKYPNVKFVYYNSDEYLKYISIAKFLINNCTFPPYWTKKEGQIYLNTWHGITRKKLWYDVKHNDILMGNTIRNFLAADYICSENDFMTKVLLNGAKLDGIGNEKIIEHVSAPRRENLLNRNQVLSQLKANGIELEKDKKIILYAPTWRGTLKSPSMPNAEEIANLLKNTNYQLLIKSHHVNYDKNQIYIPASIDTNSLMEICDILITDYSSIYFDWILSNKPVIFYTPDYDDYSEKQGLYFDFPCLPAKDLNMLKAYIENINDYWDSVKYKISSDNLNINSNGKIFSKDILNILLLQKRVQPQIDNSKIRLLFYAGDFKPNGVTSSFISLLNNLDYNKYDVSVILLKKDNPDYLEKIYQINSNARILCRAGTYSQTLLEHCANEIILQKGIGTSALKNKMPVDLYKREWVRCFGFTKFDVIINFTGYSPFYSFFFINSPTEKKIIWQHNIMKKDMMRYIDGKYPLLNALESVYSTYDYYDKIVSVSDQCLIENKKDFPLYSNKMVRCYNTIEENKILELANENTSFCSNKNTLNFINIARLSPAKNQAELIKAFKRFSNKHKNQVSLYIVGTGELENSLKQMVSNEDNIFFLNYQSNPFNILKKCDYFIFPSLYEGQGLTVLESKILSIPTIVSDLGDIRGVSDGTQDFTIRGFSEEDIYNSLKEVYQKTINQGEIIKCKPLQVDYNRKAVQEFDDIIYDCLNLWDF